jgi:uncharacterized membrane protein YwzB
MLYIATLIFSLQALQHDKHTKKRKQLEYL